jgi:hypothetical protein
MRCLFCDVFLHAGATSASTTLACLLPQSTSFYAVVWWMTHRHLASFAVTRTFASDFDLNATWQKRRAGILGLLVICHRYDLS